MRALAGIALVVALVLDGALWSRAFSRGDIDSGALLLHPERLDGSSLVLSLVDVVEVREGGYSVVKGVQKFDITGPSEDLSVGDEIYVRGIFRAEDFSMVEEWHERAPQRGGKKLLGLIGLGATALVLPFGLGWRREGLTLRG